MIPQLDARRITAREPRTMRVLARAVRDPGVFTLTDTGITPVRMRAVLDACRAVFDLPEPEPEQGASHAPRSVERLPGDDGSGPSEAEPPNDGTEVFEIETGAPGTGRPDGLPGRWPTVPTDARPVVDAYLRDATEVSVDLLRGVAEALGPAVGSMAGAFDATPAGRLRVRLDRPAPLQTGMRPKAEAVQGAAPQTECGCLTLLGTDGAPGVEVRTPEGWRAVQAPPGVFIVTFGEMLETWTGGAVRAMPSRMRAATVPRISVALVVNPAPDTIISPPGSANSLRADDHLTRCHSERRARDGVPPL